MPREPAVGGFSARIGERVGPYQEEITEAQLSGFRRAVGSSDASAPPTFLTRYRTGEFELFRRLGIELASVLHAEQAYTYAEPVIAGDVLSFSTTLVQALEKRAPSGGVKGEFSMHFLTFETRFESARGEEVIAIGDGRTTIVVRQPKVPDRGHDPAHAGAANGGAER